jgi:hypothetical protein
LLTAENHDKLPAKIRIAYLPLLLGEEQLLMEQLNLEELRVFQAETRITTAFTTGAQQ